MTYPLIVIIAFLTLVGLIGVWFVIRRRAYARRSTTWPKADGRIVESRIDVWRHDLKPDRFTPIVTYTYDVQGKAYENDRIRPESSVAYWDRARAGNILANYKKEAAVRVTYNPSNPRESFLEPPAADSAPGLSMVFGLIAVELALVGLFLALWLDG